MAINFIDLNRQQSLITSTGCSLLSEVNSRISKVFDHGQYILGPEVSELESKLSEFTGINNCIAVSSGTDALLVALMALGIGFADEVITTPFSFIATAEAIALLGATPVFVDIDPFTYNINPSLIEPSITDRTKAVIAVDLFGQPCDYDALAYICSKYSLPLIQDGAQSFGSTYHDKASFRFSTIATTSFFPSKPLGCYGDGGACFTQNDELATKIRTISRHGQTKRYYHTSLGINGRIDTIQAAILLAKLDVFPRELKMRSSVASRYNALLSSVPGLSLPFISPSCSSVFAQYTVRSTDRDHLCRALNQLGVPTSIHYPIPLCHQPATKCQSHLCQRSCSCPVSLKVSQEVFSLPMSPWLSDQEQDFVVSSLKKALS